MVYLVINKLRPLEVYGKVASVRITTNTNEKLRLLVSSLLDF